MPSGTRDAEWHVKRKSARTKRSNFQVHPAGDGFLVHGGTCFESTNVFPEESVRKRVLVLDYHRASEDVYDNLFGMMSPCFPVSSPRSILVAEEYCE